MIRNTNKTADKQIFRDFKLRAPFAMYRPVDYQEYEPFINFKPVMDAYLKKLFAKADGLDIGNKNAVDPLISDMAAKAEQNLKMQQIDHVDKIHAFHNRRAGDRRAFERELEALHSALAQNEEELEDIGQRHKRKKF